MQLLLQRSLPCGTRKKESKGSRGVGGVGGVGCVLPKGSCSPPPVSEGIRGGRGTEGGWKPRQSPGFPGQKQQPRLFLTRGGLRVQGGLDGGPAGPGRGSGEPLPKSGRASPGLSLLIPPTDSLRPFWPPKGPCASSPPRLLPDTASREPPLRHPPGCGRSSCAMGRTAQAPEQPFPEDKRLRVTGKAARRAAEHVAFGSASHVGAAPTWRPS